MIVPQNRPYFHKELHPPKQSAYSPLLTQPQSTSNSFLFLNRFSQCIIHLKAYHKRGTRTCVPVPDCIFVLLMNRIVFLSILLYTCVFLIRVYWKSVKCALRVTESFDFGRKTEYIVEKCSKLQYNKGDPETAVSG